MVNSTLCYIQRRGEYLMLHRVKKENDINKDKWIGIGGKLEEGESPFDCVLREAREETGLRLIDPEYRGLVTFTDCTGYTEQMHLFTCQRFEGELSECDEGELEWVEISLIESLPIWQGDKLFLSLLSGGEPFFSLKLSYCGDRLVGAWLNGKELKI